VDVRVDAARSCDQPLASDHLSPWTDDQLGIDAVHDVRVAGLAYGNDPPGPDADVGLDDADRGVHDDGIRDDEIEGTLGIRDTGRLGHPVPDRLSATEHHLVAGDGQVSLDLADEVRVGEPEAVTDGRPVEVRIAATIDLHVVSRPVSKPAAASALANRSLAPGASSSPATRP